MKQTKAHKSIRFPVKMLDWLDRMVAKSGRTFSGEVIHQLTLIMEKRIK